MRKAFSLSLFLVILAGVLAAGAPLGHLQLDILWDYGGFLARSLGISLLLAVAAFLVSIVPAVLLAFGRISLNLPIRYGSASIVELIRSIPELMVIFWIFFTAPMILGQALDKYTSGILALAVVNSAYLSEATRAGILSVPRGLLLAGAASGLKPWQIRFSIVLPIALRNMLPELRNRFVSLFKSTALLYVIGVTEFFNALVIINNREFIPFETMFAAGLVYFVCAYTFELVTHWMDRGQQP